MPSEDSEKLSLCQVLKEELNYLALPTDKHPQNNDKIKEEQKSKQQPEQKNNQPENSTSGKDELSEIYKRIHKEAPNRSALCLSGGGIRSATFSLGVIQGLAEHGLLGQFDYLSTVSGGGYIGGWLTAWIHRKGLKGVTEELKKNTNNSTPEPDPVKNLRSYSNYLTPKSGIMSADTWTLKAIYLRNLLLNWFLFIPLLLAALAIPRICVSVVHYHPSHWLMWSIFGFGFFAGIIPIAYIGVSYPSSNKWNKNQSTFLILCLLPLILSAISLTTFWAWYPKKKDISILCFIEFGIVLHFSGWLGYLLWSIWLSRSEHVSRLVRLSSLIHLSWVLELARKIGNSLLEIISVWGIGAAGGVLAWLMYYQLFPEPTSYSGHYVCFAMPAFLGLFLIAGTLYVGLFDVTGWLKDKDLEWLGRFGAWVLIAITIWCAGSSLVIFGPVGLLILWEKAPTLIASLGGISGIITLFFSYSSKTPFGKKQNESNGLISTLMNNALIISASIFIIFLIAALSLGTDPIIRLVNNNKLSTKFLHTKIIDKSDFWAGEFKSDATIEKLCNTINADFKYSLELPIPSENAKDSIDGLNKLLENAHLYNFVQRKNPSKSFPEKTMVLVGETKEYRHKEYADLSNDERNNRKKFNRLLLEEVYPQETPKSRSPYSHVSLISNTPFRTVFVLFLVLVIIIVFMSVCFDINKFSLHSLYRNRLIRAYLGASHTKREPNLFTGFDEHDNLKMNNLICPNNCRYILCEHSERKLFHVVNITLNLVKAGNLAWQQRMAAPFTITPLHSGCSNLPSVGYRETKEYGGKGECPAPDVTGISLGTAMTVSGAAASPNMGYHSSSVLAFLMTLFNIRLGLWLGNPADDETYKCKRPRWAIGPVISDMLGLTNEKYRYIYLSDGGHFENLGLYEMVLRRCHYIVLVDASCDNPEGDEFYTFGDLGNAIRKIRIDLGVEIELDNAGNKVEDYSIDNLIKNCKHCVIFNIKYPEIDESDVKENVNREKTNPKLIYIKPMLCKNEPIDIVSYKKDNPKFPHESTRDQWFSESQFESYRKLGFHAIEEIVEGDKKDYTLCDFFEQAENYANSSKYCLPHIPD